MKVAQRIFHKMLEFEPHSVTNTNFSYNRPSYDKQKYIVVNLDEYNVPFLYTIPKYTSEDSELETILFNYFIKLRRQFKDYR